MTSLPKARWPRDAIMCTRKICRFFISRTRLATRGFFYRAQKSIRTALWRRHKAITSDKPESSVLHFQENQCYFWLRNRERRFSFHWTFRGRRTECWRFYRVRKISFLKNSRDINVVPVGLRETASPKRIFTRRAWNFFRPRNFFFAPFLTTPPSTIKIPSPAKHLTLTFFELYALNLFVHTF